MGPFPNECCKALLDNNCIWLMGNHDSYIANGLPKEELQNFKPDKIAHQDYMRGIIKSEFKEKNKAGAIIIYIIATACIITSIIRLY